MKHLYLGLVAGLIALLSSCGPARDIVYLQDLPAGADVTIQDDGELRLEPGDIVSVKVHSRDNELAEMFNIAEDNYTVDPAGNIDLPIMGSVKVEGLTRVEVAQAVKYRLLSGSLLRDPVVTVEFPKMGYYIIGESGVGRHDFPTDKLNLLEAIAMAGDLPMSGRRKDIRVLRTEGNRQHVYEVDVTKADDLYASPVYYVKQNDMIYVQPNQMKQDQSTPYGSQYMNYTFWISIVTLAASVVAIFAK